MNRLALIATLTFGGLYANSHSLTELNEMHQSQGLQVATLKTHRYSGNAQISNSKIDWLRGEGAATIENSNVAHFQGSGICSITQSDIGTMQLSGQLTTLTTHFHNRVKITGKIQSSQSVFDGDLYVCSDDVVLDACHVKNIRFSKPATPDQEEVLILKNTLVEGTVTFDSKKGKIIMDATSKITGGIHGGQVETSA